SRFIDPLESFADRGESKRDEPNDDRGVFELDGARALELSGQSPSRLDRASNDPLTVGRSALFASGKPSGPAGPTAKKPGAGQRDRRRQRSGRIKAPLGAAGPPWRESALAMGVARGRLIGSRDYGTAMTGNLAKNSFAPLLSCCSRLAV